MIIPDTSVWVDHFRHGQPSLSDLMARCELLAHPWVVDELALGNLPDRGTTLTQLRRLPAPVLASPRELRRLLDSGVVQGRGIGFVDLAVAASTVLTPEASLWTFDRRLQDVVNDLMAR